MAVMTDPQRDAVTAAYTAHLSLAHDQLGTTVVRADVRTNVNASDDWVQANQGDYSSSLPEPFRTQADANQEARLFNVVMRVRIEEGVAPSVALDAAARDRVVDVFIQELVDLHEQLGDGSLARADYLAAANAADDWVVGKAGSYNAALVEPFKAQATNDQKSLLLQFVVDERFGLGVL